MLLCAHTQLDHIGLGIRRVFLRSITILVHGHTQQVSAHFRFCGLSVDPFGSQLWHTPCVCNAQRTRALCILLYLAISRVFGKLASPI